MEQGKQEVLGGRRQEASSSRLLAPNSLAQLHQVVTQALRRIKS